MKNTRNNFEIKLGKNLIKIVQQHKYFRPTKSFENKTKMEKLKSEEWQRGKYKLMGLRIKIKILQSTVNPVFTYGAQTWVYIAKQLWKIKTTEYAMLHKILGIKFGDRIKILDILEIAKTESISRQIKKLEFNYAEHVMRDSNFS